MQSAEQRGALNLEGARQLLELARALAEGDREELERSIGIISNNPDHLPVLLEFAEQELSIKYLHGHEWRSIAFGAVSSVIFAPYELPRDLVISKNLVELLTNEAHREPDPNERSVFVQIAEAAKNRMIL